MTGLIEDVPELLARWSRMPEPSSFPYDAIVSAYHRTGKHFVAANILDGLEVARRAVANLAGKGEEWSVLQRFLRIALDKRDGCYDYITYTAIDLLMAPPSWDRPMELGEASRERDRLTSALAADTIEFELRAADGRTDLLPEMRPERRVVERRVRLAMRAVTPSVLRRGIPSAGDQDDLVLRARDLSVRVLAESSAGELRTLQLSMLPVYIVHDEYLFIRVLQIFEAAFVFLVAQLRAAIEALTERRDLPAATGCLDAAETALRESAPLLSLLGTMQVASFHTFRAFTEGASAIQSRNYKIMESLCRRPDPDRLDSVAYRSTPEVRDRILRGQSSLDEVVTSLESGAAIRNQDRADLRKAMGQFALTLGRWRQAHYRLATNLLGEKPGTGYTEGSPYLRGVTDIPVFCHVEPSSAPDA